jgi:threonyl-tRNA synthetase
MKVIFSDGKEKTLPDGITALEALKSFDKGIAEKAAACKVDGEAVDLGRRLKDQGKAVRVDALFLDSKEGLEVFRHSTAHIMAQAVVALFKYVLPTIGPTIEDGFYYDFDSERPFTPEDLEAIENKMREIINENLPISREEISKKGALELFKGNTYKQELIEEIPDEMVSVYGQDDFVDLCRGPHLPSTGYVKAFKLTGIAGAYWRGDETKKMLQRIYGTSFATKKALDEYLAKIEEAKKRDHRKLGRELDLFSVNEEIGTGLILWHPRGSIVRGIIEDFWKKEHVKNGYSIIYTPHVAKLDLWKKSGHWDFYRENLYSPMDVEGQDYIVKPMNCPFHISIYKSRLRSYRDLPIRFAELGTVYRYERTGVLHGLLRVRGFTQDDAHILMSPAQLTDEIKGVLKFTLYILRSFGFNEFDIYLSTRPEKYVGKLENWVKAEAALTEALESEGLSYSIDPGEGVFYGPKIDIKIKDVLGRAWQCSTVQVDFNLPERLDLQYRDERGEAARPIMLHRALMGSLERFFGCLVEHYGGAFPVWLAPVQATILTVTERNDGYAESLLERFKNAGFRVDCDTRNEKLGFKIREARLKKIPYMLVVGDKEEHEGLVAPRSREKGTMPVMRPDEFIMLLEKENRPLGGETL